jgi:hypothetical protein
MHDYAQFLKRSHFDTTCSARMSILRRSEAFCVNFSKSSQLGRERNSVATTFFGRIYQKGTSFKQEG